MAAMGKGRGQKGTQTGRLFHGGVEINLKLICGGDGIVK
jgi:hypothetical protein